MKDFSPKILKALRQRGITLIGLTVIPGVGPLAFANGERGYSVNDNGTYRILSFAQVLNAAVK